jgi:hypothetical protein
MRRLVMALTAMVLAGAAATAVAPPQEKPKEVHGAGCVEPGVEARCLVVKDVKSGTLYNVFFKEPRPQIGDGIEFTGVLYDGVTYCMQGAALKVTSWTKKDSLKCRQGEVRKP